jgi:hypothetical protein
MADGAWEFGGIRKLNYSRRNRKQHVWEKPLMKLRSLFYLFLMMVFLGMAGVACGGSSDPADFGDLPTFSGATRIEPGANAFADLLADTMQSTAEEENTRTELRTYSVPDGVTWSEVEGFYTSELSDSDWELQSDLSQSNEFLSVAGWTRGSGGDEQALLIGFTADPLGGENFLILALLSE